MPGLYARYSAAKRAIRNIKWDNKLDGSKVEQRTRKGEKEKI